MIRKVVAKRSFELEDQDSGMSVKVDKGDTGELLGTRRTRGSNFYTIIIKDKTVTIGERKLLRYLFKEEREADL